MSIILHSCEDFHSSGSDPVFRWHASLSLVPLCLEFMYKQLFFNISERPAAFKDISESSCTLKISTISALYSGSSV